MGKSIKGTRTEKNLGISFAGESQARMRYTYFASAAKKEGYEQIAAIFTETADQEKEHAKRMFKWMEGGMVEITASYPSGPLPKKDTKKDTVHWQRTSKKARCLRKIPKWYGNAAIADTCL